MASTLGIFTYQLVIPVVGTPVRLVPVVNAVFSTDIMIQAPVGNAGNVLIMHDGAVNGFVLTPGQNVNLSSSPLSGKTEYPLFNLSRILVDTLNAGDVINVMYYRNDD